MAIKTAVHLIYHSTENNIELLLPNYFVSYILMHFFHPMKCSMVKLHSIKFLKNYSLYINVIYVITVHIF